MTRYKGDDTQAFGKDFITINLNNPNQYEISKVEFVVNSGCIRKPFTNPVFPLKVNFTSKETAKFTLHNTGYLIAYDNKGRPKQCNGKIEFNFENGVIIPCGVCC